MFWWLLGLLGVFVARIKSAHTKEYEPKNGDWTKPARVEALVIAGGLKERIIGSSNQEPMRVFKGLIIPSQAKKKATFGPKYCSISVMG